MLVFRRLFNQARSGDFAHAKEHSEETENSVNQSRRFILQAAIFRLVQISGIFYT